MTKAEQEAMRKVCRLAREVLDIAAAEVRPGITTDYLDEVVHKACLERDVRRHESLLTAITDNMCSHTPLRSITTTFPSPFALLSTKSFATAFQITTY